MRISLYLTVFLYFLIDLLLLLGTDRLYGHNMSVYRLLIAAILGGCHSGICLITKYYFLGNIQWRIVFAILEIICAYGINRTALRKGCAYAVLKIAFEGLAAVIGDGLWSLMWSGFLVGVLYFIGFHKDGKSGFIPVELVYAGRSVKLTALRDTGNMLRDPLSGRPVLVVDADVAHQLTGLTAEQLNSPIDAMSILPRLRLIPYHTIGTKNGLLVSMKLNKVKIGSWQGSALVAFAPVTLDPEGIYQGLTGGTL